MICPHCRSDIDADSAYCDQCGKELFLCSTCGKPGKGKRCVEDGALLVSRKRLPESSVSAQTGPQAPLAPSANRASPAPLGAGPTSYPPSNAAPVAPSASIAIPILRLVNANLNLDVTINDGDILGRTAGNHAQIFGPLNQVSGRHAHFQFDSVMGWTVRDLGSTNGTALSHSPKWDKVNRLTPNVPAVLVDNAYLLIANIEFRVMISKTNITPTGTLRI